MDTLEPHLNALAATLGLPALTLDAQGLRSIALDHQHVIHVQADPRTQDVVLYAVAGQLPPGAGMAETLLRANRFWRGTGGATLSLDDDEAQIYCLSEERADMNFTGPVGAEQASDGLFLACDYFAEVTGLAARS